MEIVDFPRCRRHPSGKVELLCATKALENSSSKPLQTALPVKHLRIGISRFPPPMVPLLSNAFVPYSPAKA